MVDDKQIMEAMAEDSGLGLRLLLGAYKRCIYWHIRRIVVSHEDAQDVTQETFVRAYRHFDQCGKNLRAWLYCIATNEAIRLIGRRKGGELVSLDEVIDNLPAYAAESYAEDAEEIVVKLQQAIKSLPLKQQLVFGMRYYDEMPYKEIAKVLDVTEAAAKVNYSLARTKIVEYMNAKML